MRRLLPLLLSLLLLAPSPLRAEPGLPRLTIQVWAIDDVTVLVEAPPSPDARIVDIQVSGADILATAVGGPRPGGCERIAGGVRCTVAVDAGIGGVDLQLLPAAPQITLRATTAGAEAVRTWPEHLVYAPIAFGGAGPGAIAPPAGGADGPVVYVCGVNYWLYLPFTDPLQPLPCP